MRPVLILILLAGCAGAWASGALVGIAGPLAGFAVLPALAAVFAEWSA